jgi:hypothetical protein
MYGTLTGAAPSAPRSQPVGQAGLISEELATVHPLPRGQRAKRAG